MIEILQAFALSAAVVAAAILTWYLVRRPPLVRTTKVLLFFGVGAFPLAAAMSGNVAGYEVTKQREFCASCHVMEPFARDAADPESTSLAAFHSRNAHFGAQSCYVCHADYGMFGAVTTKLDGLRHAYRYYRRFDEYGKEPVAPSVLGSLKLYKPYPNANCTQCHSTELPGWNDEPEHQAVAEDVRKGLTGCATSGCHGPVHPFTGRVEGTK